MTDRQDALAAVVALDPAFAAAYGRFADVPRRKGHLDAKTRALIEFAVDVNATHLFRPAVPGRIRAALDAGATASEVMETLELCATLGIHAMNIGIPILVDVMRELGMRDGPEPLTAHQQRLKADFTANRGYWHPFWDEILELDPEVFEAYIDFSSVPWRTGGLEPRVKELIYISFDTAATHLYVTGLRLHIVNALRLGATPQQVIEVMELASLLGMNAVLDAAPVLRDELARREREPAR